MYMYSNIKILKNTKFHVLLCVYNFMFNFESRLRILKLLFFLPFASCLVFTILKAIEQLKKRQAAAGKQLEKKIRSFCIFIRYIVTTLPLYYKQLFNPIKVYRF